MSYVGCSSLFWQGIILACTLAVIFQLANIWEDFVNPKLTNTTVEKKKLESYDFPLLFKICPMLGFNITALKEYGYENGGAYLEGESMFNHSMVGWGGHKNGTFEAQDSVEEVVSKVKNYDVKDIVDHINIIMGSLLFKNRCFTHRPKQGEGVRLRTMKFSYLLGAFLIDQLTKEGKDLLQSESVKPVTAGFCETKEDGG